MLNIVTALKLEAEPIIKYFKLKCKENIYKNDKINLIITGSGKIKSAINTALLLNSNPYKTLNIGIAGSSEFKIGDGFYIHKITDTESGFNYYPDFFKEKSIEIFCLSRPGKYYSLTDMESAGFFEGAYKFLSVEQIILYKIVSDTPKIPFNPSIVQDLINKHIQIIEELIETDEDNILKEIEEWLNEAKNKMHLTKTQFNQLKNSLIYLKTKQKPLPKVPLLKNKKEISEFIKNLTSSVF
ncbi:hypothetical protein [Caminibacter sp.]